MAEIRTNPGIEKPKVSKGKTVEMKMVTLRDPTYLIGISVSAC